MFGLFKNLFGSDKKVYEKQKNTLQAGTVEERRAMAASEKTKPEALYYLAKDPDPEVRRAVALNKATPVQASSLLANDKNEDVRLTLAARLVELLPDLSSEEHSQLYAYAVQALGVLAQDEVLKIRRALSTSLKDHVKAPPKVVAQLARDVEREISEPILLFCLALSDEDLLDVLSEHPEGWVIAAIAGRPVVSDRVSNAVVDTKDIPANSILIQNEGAEFSEETLCKIIEASREYPDWHEHLVVRSELSLDLARQLAGFVSDSVLHVLEKREDFDKSTREEIAELVKRRIDFKQKNAPHETARSKVDRFEKSGKLNGGIIQDALAWEDNEFVLLALSRLSKIHPIVVEKMLRSGSAKPVVALCWKAKLPMRVAVEVQRSYAKLLPTELMYAKDGTDYPMTAEEIKWQFEFYGVDK